ncbi:MAG: class I SAM-dependent methyltransferase, partial [Gemmatimonadaceae bacterium]
MNCRHCNTSLNSRDDVFVDLGSAPPSNAFLRAADLEKAEVYLPLKVLTCPACRLVQVDELQKHDALFSDDYVYFSSYSSTWLAHAKRYVETTTKRLELDSSSLVVEIASNDGYLLQFVNEAGIPCVGFEPTASTASAARERGIESIEEFFGTTAAREFVAQRRAADLIVANNVLAHVPDINDFVGGLRELLTPNGSITVEFPHLMQLVKHAQFDTVYHEHFSYLSLETVQRIFAAQGLVVWDVEELPTHGGSLRVWAQHASNSRTLLPSVQALLDKESEAGMLDDAFYRTLQSRAERIKNDLVAFLIDCKREGKTVIGYGAAAKGNTLLNFAGVRPDLLSCVADASPHKQGRFLPGSRIPVVAPSVISNEKPDYIVVLPWNIRDEVTTQLSF